ncbi:pentapeptide repeat-containing protein [Streptomyces albidoflavus]
MFGRAWFQGATFTGTAPFNFTTFNGPAEFTGAIFKERAYFLEARFERDTRFEIASFEGPALFDKSWHVGGVTYEGAVFGQDASFHEAVYEHDVKFDRAIFTRTDIFGPILTPREVSLYGAAFNSPTTLMIAAKSLDCRRTRWSSTAELRLRHASVDLSNAVFEYPLTVASAVDTFVTDLPAGQFDPITPRPLHSPINPSSVRLTSLRGVDAAHLVLVDVDLSQCQFAGTVHLDQLRMEGNCVFARTPSGIIWRGWRPVRYGPRLALADEHHWRASRHWPLRKGWTVPGQFAHPTYIRPTHLTPVYRALRKSFEDSKNEPGAADFYYGEMEMRRRDTDNSSPGERGLLHMYWAMSGYGLRALRALGWLVASMILTLVLMMQWGLPQDDIKQEATGTVPPGGGKVTFEIEKSGPVNPSGDRFTGKRFEKALKVTLNSVVFRSSGEELTTSGTYIEMMSRVVEPVFLGMAVLAIRNRVKR